MTSSHRFAAIAGALAVGLFLGGGVIAQTDHGGHDMGAMDVPATPAADGYMQAMDTMMQSMHGMKPTGDADIDFVRGMIPHHQAAIDMAKVQLQYGKDAKIRKLSEAIIVAQQEEIAQMNAWLAAHPAK